MHSRSNNVKFICYNDVLEIVDELFDSICSMYQGNLETSMGGSDFIFDSVQMLYHMCHKVKFRRGG